MPTLSLLVRLLAAALVVLAPAPVARAQAPLVAAAADLKFALVDLAARYKADTGRDVKVTFGSSGNFTQQIENGAPFEIFLSADERYIERLADKGLAKDAGTVYAIGRLALFVPNGSALKPDPSLADLRAALADGRVKRFAIANPDVAPYGRAAREALQSAGTWEAVQPALVLGENAGQAMQFAASGNAQGGLVPSALAKAPEVAKLGVVVLLAETMHRPLRQRMALLKPATPAAADFYRWLQAPEARAVFVRHGLEPPGKP
jgi:molybdate transport system substrate-binding protein